jgi:hypothetical protein
VRVLFPSQDVILVDVGAKVANAAPWVAKKMNQWNGLLFGVAFGRQNTSVDSLTAIHGDSLPS